MEVRRSTGTQKKKKKQKKKKNLRCNLFDTSANYGYDFIDIAIFS